MSKQTITPGPWVARISGNNQQVMGANIDSETERTEQGYLRGICFCSQHNCEANAQAIAAVPEMIEALRCAIPWLAKILADGTHLKCATPRDAEMAYERANNALRKSGQID